MSQIEPTREEIDRAVMEVALRQLDAMPVGSSVMVSQCIGFKSMPFWWNVRVHGFLAAARCWIRSAKARRNAKDTNP